MEKMLNPIVINSKAADEHYDDIKIQHADLVKGIQDQALRVANYKAEKEMKDNEQKTSEAASEKERIDAENKRRELDIKEQALMI